MLLKNCILGFRSLGKNLLFIKKFHGANLTNFSFISLGLLSGQALRQAAKLEITSINRLVKQQLMLLNLSSWLLLSCGGWYHFFHLFFLLFYLFIFSLCHLPCFLSRIYKVIIQQMIKKKKTIFFFFIFVIAYAVVAML